MCKFVFPSLRHARGTYCCVLQALGTFADDDATMCARRMRCCAPDYITHCRHVSVNVHQCVVYFVYTCRHPIPTRSYVHCPLSRYVTKGPLPETELLTGARPPPACSICMRVLVQFPSAMICSASTHTYTFNPLHTLHQQLCSRI